MKPLLAKSKTFFAGLVLFQVLGGGLSHAATITLNFVDSGWWENTGFHIPSIQNYIAGESFRPFAGFRTFRNFFVFDLSGVTDPIVGATLRLFNPAGGFASLDPTETYTLFDVSTPIASLTAGGAGMVSIHTDLGSGTQYGSQIVSAADNGAIVNISLNGNALTALNGASGLFAIGGAVTTLVSPLDLELIFGITGSSTDVRHLVVETLPGPSPGVIPEPSTVLLLGSGLAGLFAWRMRKGRA